ncbi:MAG: hypothetical protein ABF289_16105, partial [Clostridiales bacterium]
MAKLEGSTIVETIVATLIISLCFEIAIISISKLYLSNKTSDLINASYMADEIIAATIKDKDFTNKMYTINNNTIKQEVSSFNNISDLKLIKIEISNNKNIAL